MFSVLSSCTRAVSPSQQDGSEVGRCTEELVPKRKGGFGWSGGEPVIGVQWDVSPSAQG